ncbi:MAG: ATP-binding protein [Phycisphaerae bacterium]
MKRRSFFFKLVVGSLLLVLTMVAVTIAVSYSYLDAEYHQKDQLHQQHMLTLLQQQFQRQWSEMPPARIDAYLKELDGQIPARVTVVAIGGDVNGKVLGDSEARPREMDPHGPESGRPEIRQAVARGDLGLDTRTSETLNIPFRYMALPIRQNGQIVGVVRVAMPVRAIVEGRSYIWSALLWAAVVGVTVAGGLGLLVSWIWSRPLRQITRTARRVAAGDLTARAPISGSEELAQLAIALNEMRENLAEQIDMIADQRENLNTVVANLREGVVALDAEQNIVLMNEAARKVLVMDGESEATGKHIQSVVRLPEVTQALKALAGEETFSAQFNVHSNAGTLVLDLHAARLGGAGKTGIHSLLVVRDITDIARMATIKAEFVANTSHELRTPLATLRAATESLQAIDPADREAYEKCVSILSRHLDRLENLTNDLLDLHLIEQAKSTLAIEQIGLPGLAQWARSHSEARAEEKGISFSVVVKGEQQEFHSDRRLLELILQNLLDNAAKFTPEGGDIQCVLQHLGSTVRITVRDTGCGIPVEMQNRVFERFFQVDQSRTGGRKRGTGLGLAIVKYAAERLGATVNLQSQPGEGTVFVIDLPTGPRKRRTQSALAKE